MSFQVAMALIVGLAASAEDLWRRQVSNWICLSALLSGIFYQCNASGWRGLLDALVGAAAGFGIFLIFYLLGGMGGGDVKLMAGFGSLLGVSRLVEAAIWTAILGALLAVVVLGIHSVRCLVKKEAVGRPKAIPYAPAITAGVWLSLVPR